MLLSGDARLAPADALAGDGLGQPRADELAERREQIIRRV
jgi:hypothetical protein